MSRRTVSSIGKGIAKASSQLPGNVGKTTQIQVAPGSKQMNSPQQKLELVGVNKFGPSTGIVPKLNLGNTGQVINATNVIERRLQNNSSQSSLTSRGQKTSRGHANTRKQGEDYVKEINPLRDQYVSKDNTELYIFIISQDQNKQYSWKWNNDYGLTNQHGSYDTLVNYDIKYNDRNNTNYAKKGITIEKKVNGRKETEVITGKQQFFSLLSVIQDQGSDSRSQLVDYYANFFIESHNNHNINQTHAYSDNVKQMKVYLAFNNSDNDNKKFRLYPDFLPPGANMSSVKGNPLLYQGTTYY